VRRIVHNYDKVMLDDGVFFGRGIFETILCKEKPIYLEEHLQRLKKDMLELNLQPLVEEKFLRDHLSKLEIKNKVLKITVTPLNIIITEREIAYKNDDYKKGMSLTISKVRRNSTSRLASIKSTCYIENIIEKENAKKLGYDDVIFLNEKGNVTETSCANIFMIKNNEIFTPNSEDGLLKGIIRDKIMKKFKVTEKSITIDDLTHSEEVIITNSIMGAMSIKQINETKYNSEKFRHIFNENLRN